MSMRDSPQTEGLTILVGKSIHVGSNKHNSSAVNGIWPCQFTSSYATNSGLKMRVTLFTAH